MKESHSRFLAPYVVSVAQVVRLIQLAIDNRGKAPAQPPRGDVPIRTPPDAPPTPLSPDVPSVASEMDSPAVLASRVAGVAARARVAAIARVASRACVAAEGRAGEPAGARQSRCAAGVAARDPDARLTTSRKPAEVRRRG